MKNSIKKLAPTKISPARIFMYLFLIVICVFSGFPFLWMLSAATNKSTEIIQGRLLPGGYFIENIKYLLNNAGLVQAFWNSLRNTIIGTVLCLFICSMAGYGFQIYRSKGKDRLLAALLISMMVPMAAIMVPLFKLFSQAHLLDTTLGFVLPSVSTAFMIFFFRQSSVSFPLEIVQAARVDGLSEAGIYARIYFPVMAPTFAAAAIVVFMNSWNSYMWPLIIMQSQSSRTMPLLVASLSAGYVTDYGAIMLAVTVCTLPTVILFFTQQKRFVAGILGSVK
jgi:lactose/L-arabinose transport system permease protein